MEYGKNASCCDPLKVPYIGLQSKVHCGICTNGLSSCPPCVKCNICTYKKHLYTTLVFSLFVFNQSNLNHVNKVIFIYSSLTCLFINSFPFSVFSCFTFLFLFLILIVFILFCFISFYFILSYLILSYLILSYSFLFYFILFYSILFYSILFLFYFILFFHFPGIIPCFFSISLYSSFFLCLYFFLCFFNSFIYFSIFHFFLSVVLYLRLIYILSSSHS